MAKKPRYYEMPEQDALGRPFTSERWLAFLYSMRRDLVAQARRQAHTSRGGLDRELERLKVSIAMVENQK